MCPSSTGNIRVGGWTPSANATIVHNNQANGEGQKVSEQLLVQRDGRVVTLSLNRPPVNAFNQALLAELAETVTALANDGTASVIVLRSALEGIFSAGADLKSRPENDVILNMPGDSMALSRSLQFTIADSPLPIIAAVRGTGVGLGFLLPALCDFLVAGRNAKFGLPEIQIRAIGGAGHARRLLPEPYVRYMMLTGRRVPAEELHRIGAIPVLVDDEKVDETAATIAAEIARYDPAVVRNTKMALETLKGMDVRLAYPLEHKWHSLLASQQGGLSLAPEFHHHGE